MAQLINLRVNEIDNIDADNLTRGIYYSGNPTTISNSPSGISNYPTVIIYIGKSGGSDRGLQIMISLGPNDAKIFIRGLIYNGWTSWRSISLQ